VPFSALPFFITIEGGEGAGKTTLIDALEAKMSQANISYIRTREPGKTWLGEKIRQLLLETSDLDRKICSQAELLLFLAGRAQQIDEVLQPALQQNKSILCDRFNDSTIAYQGVARALGFAHVDALCRLVCGKIVPDLTFLLDMDPSQAFGRIQNRPIDKMESEPAVFHTLVRQGFLQIAKKNPERVILLDAKLPKDEICAKAWQVIEHRFLNLI